MTTDIRITRSYPHPRARVWRALVDPDLIRLWLMRPEGFAPAPGTKFRLVAKPQPGWRGYVDCEVLEVRENELLRYSWVGDEGAPAMEVRFALEDAAGGTRLTFAHTGFKGLGGFLLAKLMMGPGWRKMLGRALPGVLAQTGDDGSLLPGTTLQPKY
ncbi:MAG: SRPBCC family protein [Myxococcales bacterium]